MAPDKVSHMCEIYSAVWCQSTMVCCSLLRAGIRRAVARDRAAQAQPRPQSVPGPAVGGSHETWIKNVRHSKRGGAN